MRKILFVTTFIIIYINSSILAQVGINTSNPAGIFHIDAQSNTDALNITSDDIVVLEGSGNVGLGTIYPTHKLHVVGNGILNGNITIQDGSQKEDRVWTSDENGTGTWVDLNSSKGTLATYNRRAYFTIKKGENTFYDTEKMIGDYEVSGGGCGGGEYTSFENSFFTEWGAGVPMADRVPIDGTSIKSRYLYMIHSGEYLFWFNGLSIFDKSTKESYPGQLYGIVRIRIGNTGLGSTEGIIFEKEYLYSSGSESFYAKIDIPTPYTWTPIYITFQRYNLQPSLDWVRYPNVDGNQTIQAGFDLIKLDAWNLK